MVFMSSNIMVLRVLAAGKMKDGGLQLESCMSEVCLYALQAGGEMSLICMSAPARDD